MMTRRVLVIALDGFEPSLADSLQAQGQMPAWGALKARAAEFPLEHGWAATRTGLAAEHFSTGLAPDAAGRYAAVDFDPKTYAISQTPTGRAPFTAGLAAKTVVFDAAYFDLNQAPNAQGIVNWGAHDPGVPRASRPADLDAEMTARFGAYPAEEWIYGFVWQSPERARKMGEDLVAAVKLRTQAAKWLLAERLPDWDLGLVMVSECHSGIEGLWHGIDPAHPLAGLPSAPIAGEAMTAIYRAIDDLIGELTAAFPDAAVLVSSMHGMGTNDSDPASMVLLSELLHRAAFGRPYLKDGGWETLADGTPVLAADGDWHDEMRVLAPDSRSRFMRLRDRLAGRRDTNLDWMPAARYRGFWPKMDAFALPSFYDGRIRVNLKGREARGRVALADYEATLDRLEQMLTACVDPQTGRPVVKALERAAHADPMAVGPTESDLTVVWQGPGLGMSHPSLGTIGPVPFRRPGGHTGPLGVVFVAADGVAPGMRDLRSSFDIAPTIVDLLGQPSAPISGTSVLA